MNEMPWQKFRSEHSSGIVSIPTLHDPTTGKHIVRWKDIQQHFDGAKRVLNGDVAVLFLTGDQLEE
jgi:hypothetical protein